MTALLQIRDLVVAFDTEEGVVTAVDGISLELCEGETLALVGESGCGKSVTAMSVLGLLSTPPARIVSGSILLDGRDLLTLPEPDLRRLRGNDVAMVFQEPMTSLNPVLTVGTQVAEPLRLHQGLGAREARTRSIALLEQVGIPAPAVRVDDFPHQLSGGMKQRVMIAMALACDPRVLIADEPTTALDVTIQAQILELLAELQEQRGMSVLLITHDLGVVAETADRVAVMYAGRLVEQAPTARLFETPRHPYTWGLMGSLPGAPGRRLVEIPGSVPHPLERPTGCRFRSRCSSADEACARDDPPLVEEGEGHRHACLHPLEAADRLRETAS